MSEEMTSRIETKSGAPFIRNYNALKNVDDRPEKFVGLQYSEDLDPEYVNITAINHHQEKSIKAYFYILKGDGCGFTPGSWPDKTVKACLKPSESTILHFEEKKHNPRLFLFNASYADCD